MGHRNSANERPSQPVPIDNPANGKATDYVTAGPLPFPAVRALLLVFAGWVCMWLIMVADPKLQFFSDPR